MIGYEVSVKEEVVVGSCPKFCQLPVFLLSLSSLVFAADGYQPKISEKSPDAERAIKGFKIPAGTRVELFAAEPMIANPVTFCFDDKGRAFVAETFRQQKGVEDNRGHMNWLIDDLAAQTVADRLAFFKKYMKDDVQKWAAEHDRIRLIEDTDGDGVADKSTVYADGFNAIEEGTGAGLLAIDNDLFFTCIPKLWKLTDTTGSGVADKRVPLYDGFGVRVAFRGHDMHGLVLGPDGRIYFSIGDRGYNVELKNGGRLIHPDQGAVFRCEIDGSNLEEFCTGLRNPQELAFDEFGNLFTGDNNSDSGDRARWVYLTEGSDTGWRMYYQYLDDRGPWNREKLWHTAHAGQAAYIVPPIAHFADGPSGLAYYPGTGLDDKYQGHFFLADFRGQASNSGVRTFSLVSKGASFELVNAEQFIWSVLVTDVDFGYDGGVYFLDWVDGWDGSSKGRLYRLRDEKYGQTAAVKDVTHLMREGFDGKEPGKLAALLSHPDYRVRLRAQIALAKKHAVVELVAAATKGADLHSRLHGIWGIGQLARQKPDELKPLLSLLEDTDPEVRVQMARVCGDANYQPAGPALAKLVKDSNPRVQLLAAIALGKLKFKPAVKSLLEVLAEDDNRDPTLRHGIVMGLAGCATREELVATARMPLPAIRLGAVVALRRMGNPGLTAFLADTDPVVVTEAVRAIHDLHLVQELPAVAKLLGQPGLTDAATRRVLSANYQLGTMENATAVAAFVGNPLNEDHLRLEALRELDSWNSPGPLDRVTNEYQPLPKRQVDIAAVARPWLGAIFSGSPKIREVGTQLAAHHGIADVEPYLIQILKNANQSGPTVRVAALAALRSLKSPQLAESVELALNDSEPDLRSEARRVLSSIDPVRAVKSLASAASSSSIHEQQDAVRLLADLKRDDADAVLVDWMTKLLAGKAAPEVQLDLLNAAQARKTAPLLAKAEAYDKARPADDHLRDYREALVGGDVTRGRDIFFGRSDVSCRRCHKINGSGGDVGPDLSKIGLDKKRDYLLESIVDPNKQIAKGFETAILEMADGKVYAGIIKRDDDQHLHLQQPDGQVVIIDKSQIEERATGKSGMPEDLVKKMTKADIRDLVEYLSTLKTSDAAEHGHKEN